MEKPIHDTSLTTWRAGKPVALALIILIVASAIAYSSQFHVTASGPPGGNGSTGQPWSLQTALNHPPAVQPGDTIWVHGGTYNGVFASKLTGTASEPILVRNWNNERATIDGGNSNGVQIFTIKGSYVWYWGLEITSSATNRVSAEATSWPTDIMYGEGVMIEQGGSAGTGCKFINMIVHDTRQGFSSWKEAVDTEVYGCVVYDNGWLGPDRPHGHNFYIQNVSGTKVFSDNFILRAYSHNIQAYGSAAAYVNNLQFTGNIGMNGGERNFMMGSGNVAANPVWRDNVMYNDGTRAGANLFFMSYGIAGSEAAVVVGNHFVSGGLTFNKNSGMNFSGNTMYNAPSDGEVPAMAGNTVLTARPGTNTVLLRPNKYDPKRANIAVLNWTGLDAVDVDVSAILRSGDAYEVRDAQNYFGSPVLSGTYTGGALRLPMTGGTVSPRMGNDPRTIVHTLKDFGTFVLIGSGSGTVQPSVSGSMSASPSSLPAGGGTVTLTWSSQNATAGSIDQGIGSVATSGSRSVQVATSSTFTLTLDGTGGTVTSQASVQVSASIFPAVVHLVPVHGATGLDTIVNLNWNALAGAIGYELQVGTDPLFTNLVYSRTSILPTNQEVSGLAHGTTYYWRVRAKNAVIMGPFASAWTFTTAAERQGPFPIVLLGYPPEEDDIVVNTAKPPGVDTAFVTMWVYDADGGNEGALLVNGKDSLDLWGPDAIPARDNTRTSFTMRMSAAAWNDGANSLRFAHYATAGYRVDSIEVAFRKPVITSNPGPNPGNDTPLKFALGENFPNPFNPSTMISFDVGTSSRVTLTVYNLLGQKVATIVDEIKPAGSYRVRFDGTGLSSGIYFYQLTTGDGFSARKTMLLVK